MKRWWQAIWTKQSARIDALSLRERAFLFFSVLACCIALADVLWLSPAQVAHQQLKQRFDKQGAELQRLRDTLKSTPQPVDASRAAREEIASVKSRTEALEQDAARLMPARAGQTPLAQVLVPLLRRHEGLTLVRTVALAPEASAKAPATGASAAAAPVALTRQGVELTVAGAYPELTRYVQTLEQELPYVRWGTLKLKGDKLPPELTLQLFLVGVPP